jgi:hypothetical protein
MEAEARPKAQTGWIPMICPSNAKITFREAVERPADGFSSLSGGPII